MAIPVGIEPSMQVKGRQVELGIKVGELAITADMIWLGAHVSVDIGRRREPRRLRRRLRREPRQAGGLAEERTENRAQDRALRLKRIVHSDG